MNAVDPSIQTTDSTFSDNGLTIDPDIQYLSAGNNWNFPTPETYPGYELNLEQSTITFTQGEQSESLPLQALISSPDFETVEAVIAYFNTQTVQENQTGTLHYYYQALPKQTVSYEFSDGALAVEPNIQYPSVGNTWNFLPPETYSGYELNLEKSTISFTQGTESEPTVSFQDIINASPGFDTAEAVINYFNKQTIEANQTGEIHYYYQALDPIIQTVTTEASDGLLTIPPVVKELKIGNTPELPLPESYTGYQLDLKQSTISFRNLEGQAESANFEQIIAQSNGIETVAEAIAYFNQRTLEESMSAIDLNYYYIPVPPEESSSSTDETGSSSDSSTSESSSTTSSTDNTETPSDSSTSESSSTTSSTEDTGTPSDSSTSESSSTISGSSHKNSSSSDTLTDKNTPNVSTSNDSISNDSINSDSNSVHKEYPATNDQKTNPLMLLIGLFFTGAALTLFLRKSSKTK
ncbi:hypothetical protein [Enterococcus hermanniensis]|uniref:Uncharacterized protein n=1 Tax=Enterococcus hermanniensis TaxID=249189 RepID=A0A1L8TLP9_9ENTE|nr:hypothetical protein [Enterococcus hermanniensis]OJG45251.1 hypothetical protein RV04_GL002299 [Enterococcus hermanniensis]